MTTVPTLPGASVPGARLATEPPTPGWYASLPLVRRLPVEWQPNPRVFLTMLPVLVFYGLTKVAPAEVAIGGGFAAVTVVFLLTRETPLLRLIAIYGYIVTAGSALAGILLTSEKAYLAAGPIGDALILPLYAWTLWRGWPLIGAIGREISPRMVGPLPVNAPIFVRLTVIWAAYEATKALVLTWMLLNLSIGDTCSTAVSSAGPPQPRWSSSAAASSCAKRSATARRRRQLRPRQRPGQGRRRWRADRQRRARSPAG